MEAKPHLRRPPSYSDSLFFLPSEPLEPLLVPSRQQLQIQIQEQPQQNEFGIRPIPYTNAEIWYNRCMSFLFHISLISLFETVFFFQFISVSEDSGLQTTLDGYITNILTSCSQWSPNQTIVANDILSVLINTTEVTEAYETAVQERRIFNDRLQLQSWMYVATLVSSTGVLGWIGKCVPLRLAWKRILVDNLIMVSLLGLYEFLFFRTIIYHYDTMSLPELNQFIVGQLQQTCGLLMSP
jgi:hypothetical protein